MTDAPVFANEQKVRQAEFIMPPNKLKQKAGSGGLDESILQKAEESLQKNDVDFQPIAEEFLQQIDAYLKEISEGTLTGEPAIEAIIYPAMQLKAQGTMFHFPIATDIANILVNFLETVITMDEKVAEIILAHRRSLTAVLQGKMRDPADPKGAALKTALLETCTKYYKTRRG